ncbi:GNAT family N-acetyltransferase [Burkholderia sp. Ac-20379]|uniref:GNAT family N-acetyltransferase n=1 Tax=Burkholderia sp. Ac-20379 TaxID=2703900 RepID=UPI0019826384|nr:GNAT family protein [Burkholderia sp. Ac-20379]MBN3723233.1 N-acetyltransferase [Burkholderia sp. Ac-20379]
MSTPIDALRSAEAGVAHYTMTFERHAPSVVAYRWVETIDPLLGERIIALMRHTTEGAPIIGFAESISDREAADYLIELQGNLAAQKVRLLAIEIGTDTLIGLCTLRRNLNPNNSHLTDLAKGMIHQDFRGGGVLPAAFVEIALRCEAEGVDIVTLDVRADTPAHRVWKHFGFETWGVLPDYARAQGSVHAGHFMMQPVAALKARALGMLEARIGGPVATS